MLIPTQDQIDETLKLIVKRLYELYPGVSKNFIKAWMSTSLVPLHNCTALQYVYLGLGQIVLNHIDDLKEKENVSTVR